LFLYPCHPSVCCFLSGFFGHVQSFNFSIQVNHKAFYAETGGYDGFFGPGTGTFLITGYVVLLGLSFRRATANAKIVNFASNSAALVVFAVQGAVVWSLAVPMLVAQMAGGWTGAHLAVKGGSRFVRLVVFVVALALVAKVAYDLHASRG
jgi:uncharacterized membrane protein YfcA